VTVRYLLRRLATAIGVLWAAFTVSFVVLYLLPGDPVATMASGGLDGEPLPPEQLDALRARYGLDQPVLVQYGKRLLAALTGDFGTSIQNGQDVRSAILEALPPTLQISVAGLVVAVLFGGTVALVATYARVLWLRQLLMALPAAAGTPPGGPARRRRRGAPGRRPLGRRRADRRAGPAVRRGRPGADPGGRRRCGPRSG
jgi:peptide/nickel transport system permease protein